VLWGKGERDKETEKKDRKEKGEGWGVVRWGRKWG
jgi:hypothetical protein